MAKISLTPRFSGVIGQRARIKTVLTVFRSLVLLVRHEIMKTVKTVLGLLPFVITPLKRGVNERLARYSIRTGATLKGLVWPSN